MQINFDAGTQWTKEQGAWSKGTWYAGQTDLTDLLHSRSAISGTIPDAWQTPRRPVPSPRTCVWVSSPRSLAEVVAKGVPHTEAYALRRDTTYRVGWPNRCDDLAHCQRTGFAGTSILGARGQIPCDASPGPLARPQTLCRAC
ncbi:hypothetical protein ACFQ64_19570 [Streptomyces sp. NPDC056460]|uniref:hypothetical protein n=1 Tax=Streptomyces sp. NPDC056460 TaxID=3345825 RepID=UPI00369252A0